MTSSSPASQPGRANLIALPPRRAQQPRSRSVSHIPFCSRAAALVPLSRHATGLPTAARVGSCSFFAPSGTTFQILWWGSCRTGLSLRVRGRWIAAEGRRSCRLIDGADPRPQSPRAGRPDCEAVSAWAWETGLEVRRELHGGSTDGLRSEPSPLLHRPWQASRRCGGGC